jgi:methylthioribose-1-phosphate isomerase
MRAIVRFPGESVEAGYNRRSAFLRDFFKPASVEIPDLHTLRASEARDHVEILDQTRLPQARVTVALATAADAARAIRSMQVRGAPLIGATAAFGLALALRDDPSDAALESAYALLLAARPTAVNLRWALDRVRVRVAPLADSARAVTAWDEADAIAGEDVMINRALGEHGLHIIETLARRKGKTLQILTHCNAGALATLGWGTATAPIYLAHRGGIPLHVWVSETRPRLQGARLTAWELRAQNVPHTLLVDAAGAALMRQGRVDLVLVGADRVTRNGDVCNKIGTYEKALAARDNGVPMYAAVPSATIDWTLASGDEVPIEERDAAEVLAPGGEPIAPPGTAVVNPAFDVTRGELLTGLITERGICAASSEGLRGLFPERGHG